MTTHPLNEVAAAAPSRAALRVRALGRDAVLVAAGTAAIALLGQLAVPLPFTPVPVTLGTLAVLGVGGLLGSRRGAASALLLAGLAAAGVPVLHGWTSGVTATFGYVLGYVLVAVVAALTVSVSMRVVGALLVSAVMIVPVAIAQLVSYSFARTMRLAMGIGVAACVSGLTITYFVAASPGAMIVVLLVGLYALVALVGGAVRLAGAGLRWRAGHGRAAPSARPSSARES